jgi:hypothetical protein
MGMGDTRNKGLKRQILQEEEQLIVCAVCRMVLVKERA